MTTTDPTITIAGLRAQVESLIESIGRANSQCASFCDIIDESRSVVARVEAERDALAAQLSEVRAQLDAAPKVCAIHSYELDGPCMTCGAWPPGTRELIAACRTRIAGLEQAANERSRTTCNGSCDIALASRQVGPDGIVPRNARECAELWEREAARLWREETRLAARVAELEARPVLDVGRLAAALNQCELGPRASDIMRHLGPVTLPPAQDRAEELLSAFVAEHGALLDRSINGEAVVGDVRVVAMSRALASLGAPPTSPPAARPVFAGVSASDLDVAYIGGQRECHRRHEGAIKDCCRYAAVAAVLARLEVSLVAPVDPEEVAWSITKTGGWVTAADAQERRQVVGSVVRATLTAAGIPVTPEVGK